MVTHCAFPFSPRDIQDRSIIKIYRKEPLYAAFPGSHLTNGDLRVWLGIPRGLGRLGRWGPGAQSLVVTRDQGQLLGKGTERLKQRVASTNCEVMEGSLPSSAMIPSSASRISPAGL